MLTTSEIIKKYDLCAKKSLGQNFLTNPELLTKIVKCAGNLEYFEVLEIGTGPGGLTTAILKEKPKKLITIDMDKRCIDIANKEIKPYFENLEVIFEDGLKIQENKIFSNKFKIIANLPYNIGTALLLKWLENCVNSVESITLLLQKEVVDRIVANKKTKDYGRLSIICQYLCNVKKCFDISPTAFLPQPKVTSTVICLTPKKNIDINIIKKLSYVTQILFNQRRKTVYNNLKKITDNAEKFLNDSSINLNYRAEELSVGDFINITKCIYNKQL